MTRTVLLMILASVVMSALAQIAMKSGMSDRTVVDSLAGGVGWPAAARIAATPLVWLGLGIYAASAVVWLLVLARVEVSLAYPFVGLGFVLTMFLGWLVHDDALTVSRVAGTLLVVAGVVVLAKG